MFSYLDEIQRNIKTQYLNLKEDLRRKLPKISKNAMLKYLDNKNLQEISAFDEAYFFKNLKDLHSAVVFKNSFIKKLLEQFDNNKYIFNDMDWPASSLILGEDDKYKNVKWLRPHEILNKNYKEIVLYDKIEVDDIKQGQIGNCYMLAVLSSIAEYPCRIQHIIINDEVNEHGIYSVRIYDQGNLTEIIIDDKFPCINNKPIGCFPQGNELWVLLIEKAWVKFSGTYQNAESGIECEFFEHITRMPSISITKSYEIWDNLAELSKYLVKLQNLNYLMTVSSKSDAPQVVPSHAYSLLDAYYVSEDETILKLRNPWVIQFCLLNLYHTNFNYFQKGSGVYSQNIIKQGL